MKFIKVKGKYYKLGEEINIVEYKANLQKHLDTVKKRKKEYLEKIKDQIILEEEEAFKDLGELNKL